MITAERLWEVTELDDEHGILRRKVGRYAGQPLGTLDAHGYLVATVDGKQYKVHRLIWLYVYGKWPDNQIDHANRVKTDNRITNLRDSTIAQNRQNRVRKPNAVGLTGVYASSKNRFCASIKCNGKKYNLGNFETAKQAHDAYLSAKRKLHKKFACFPQGQKKSA